MTRRAIVTGASGFVGANLARRLIAEGHEVHLLLRQGYAIWRLADVSGSAMPHTVDVGNAEETLRVVGAIRPDWVFHLAVHGAYPGQTNIRRMVDANIVGSINLLEACLQTGFEAFVNTGSSCEYGFKDYPPSETDWLEPNSSYAVTKAASTLYCRSLAQRQGLHLTTLRLYSVYGPYEEPTRLIPRLIVEGLRGRLPRLANSATARDYVYIDDVCDAYLRAARHNGEPGAVYNVGSGTQTSLREIVETVRRVLGIQAEPAWGSMPDRAWDTACWVADIRSITRSLGWAPGCSLEDGLRRTAEWLRAEPALLARYQGAAP